MKSKDIEEKKTQPKRDSRNKYESLYNVNTVDKICKQCLEKII